MKTVKDMIIDILDSGMKEDELAKLVGTTQPSINRMRRGVTVDTSYTMGKAFESIYIERTGMSAPNPLSKHKVTRISEHS